MVSQFVLSDESLLSNFPYYKPSSHFFNWNHLHVGNGVSWQLKVDSHILGGVGVRDIVLMLHIPEVQSSPSLPSILLATPLLST